MLNDTEIRNFMKSVATDKTRLKTKIDEILDYLDSDLHSLVSPEHWDIYTNIHDMVEGLIGDEDDI